MIEAQAKPTVRAVRPAGGSGLRRVARVGVYVALLAAAVFYVIPVYRTYLERGWRVELSVAREVWDLGTPAGKAAFEASHQDGSERQRRAGRNK